MPKRTKAFELPLRDVLDIAAVGDVETLEAFLSRSRIENASTAESYANTPRGQTSGSGESAEIAEGEAALAEKRGDDSEAPSPTKSAAPGTTGAATAAPSPGKSSVASTNLATVEDLVHFTNDEGYSALHVAATYGHYRVVQLLLDCGADMDAQTATGDSALHLAASNGHRMVVKLLLSRNCNVLLYNDRYETALGKAMSGRFSAIQVLIEPVYLSKVKATDALIAASQGEIIYFLDLLVRDQNRCKVELMSTTEQGDNILHVIAKVGAFQDEHMNVVKLLLDKNLVSINEANPSKMTALMYATRNSNAALVEILLKHGADPTLSADDEDPGRTAASFTNNKRLQLLLTEQERKMEFDAMYSRRNSIPYHERPDFIATVTGLKKAWDDAKREYEEYVAEQQSKQQPQAASAQGAEAETA